MSSWQELLHQLLATAQAQHQVQRGLLLDVVVGQRAAVLELLACVFRRMKSRQSVSIFHIKLNDIKLLRTREDEALLVRRNALLVLDLGLDVVDRVRGLHIKGDGLAS